MKYRLFVLTAALLLSLASCADNRPYITSINPKFGSEGDILTINGKNFGDDAFSARSGQQSFITVAGERPTASSYLLWTDSVIKIKITQKGISGLVYVFVDGAQSNGALFSDRESIPEIPGASKSAAVPLISAVSPQVFFPGSLITIDGSGFGADRKAGAAFVTFTWNTLGRTERQALPVSIFEGGYESWSEREIRIRVPDGAGSGLVEVNTAAGLKAVINASLNETYGKKVLRDNRDYIVDFQTDVIVQEASPPNTLYIALPLPAQTASQKISRRISSSVEPFAENLQGTALYKFKDLKSGESRGAALSLVVSVYTLETSGIQAAQSQDTSLPVYKDYLGGTALVPAANDAVKAKSASIVGRERSPYQKARLIFSALLKELDIKFSGDTRGGALSALESGAAGPYEASLLFCALCRAAGLPAAPLAGVLIIDGKQTVNHYWAAFWLDGLGWIPVDLSFAQGKAPEGWTLRPDFAQWYFGNMDNQRIAFSFGETILAPLENESRIVRREHEYALQNIWEEASGGIEAYSSLWSGISINGVYYH